MSHFLEFGGWSSLCDPGDLNYHGSSKDKDRHPGFDSCLGLSTMNEFKLSL